MKKLVVAIAIAISATMTAQTESKSKKVTVPTNVEAAFAKDFPAGKAKWGMENGNYEAEFKLKGGDVSAVYDKTGHRKEVETDIKSSELPKAALDYLKKNYPTNKISEAAKITDDKNVITYEAEIKIKGKSKDLLFDAAGKFIKIVEAD